LSRDFFVFLLTIKSIYAIIKKVKSHYRLFQVYQMIMVVQSCSQSGGDMYDVDRNLPDGG
jgi:hypothetical protein